MAKKVQIILEDDIDGSEAAETVSFALDGTSYEIDLSDANAAKLRDSLALFVGHAQKVSGRRGSAKKAPAAGGSTPKVMREWGRPTVTPFPTVVAFRPTSERLSKRLTDKLVSPHRTSGCRALRGAAAAFV